ncbi:MAG: thermonuclease family protein [Candidatus Pacearchaeota archaeon]|nr:thermonuclease family protein [Candidatus Pacearchaeota archaeon]
MKLLNILIFLIILVNLVFLGYFTSTLTGNVVKDNKIEYANLTRAIDGDTIELQDGRHCRLLGINTPEKNKPFYQEAKDYLKQYENLTIELEMTNEDKDKYSRLLRYIFHQSTFINEEILARGLANLYVYQEDKYTPRLEKAEAQARSQGLGIWQKSQDACASCIILKELNPVDPGEFVILKNICSFTCDLNSWQIKDTANHFTILDFSLQPNQEKKLDYDKIWNDA